MKRTCYGCKALDSKFCSLGYQTENIYKDYTFINIKPLEECPKPKTNNEYIKEMNKN